MNNRESEFARNIARHLDQAAAGIRPGTLYRLKQARAAAMANLAPAASATGELAAAGVGSVSDGPSYFRSAAVRWLGVALFVAVAGFAYQQWHSMQQVYEFEDLDLHLLASDLPIDAYLDRGFQNWLRTGFER